MRNIGYKSYSYLNQDYKDFEIEEYNDSSQYKVALDENAELKVLSIIKNNPLVDLHEHPFKLPKDLRQAFAYCKEGRIVTDFDGLAHSCLDAVFDNHMAGYNYISSKAGWRWDDIIHDIGMRSCDIAHQNFLIKAETIDDIFTAKKAGKIAWIIAQESATMIEGELDRVDILFGLGLRMMGITYSEANALGSGYNEKADAGLTHLGERVIARMNKVGVAIDVSHCGYETAMDTIKCSKKPVFISHSGAKTLWPSARHLFPDNVLKACADKGGIIGIIGAPHSSLSKKHPRHDIEAVMDHFEYVKDLVGIDHVAFGPDTFSGDHVGLQNLLMIMKTGKPLSEQGYENEIVPFVKGFDNVAETSWNTVRWLVKNGYSDEDISKIIGGNVIRVLREVWPK